MNPLDPCRHFPTRAGSHRKFDPVPAFCCSCIKKIPDLVPAMKPDRPLSWFSHSSTGVYNPDFHPGLIVPCIRSSLKFQMGPRSLRSA